MSPLARSATHVGLCWFVGLYAYSTHLSGNGKETIVLGIIAAIAGLVDENRKIPHELTPLNKKNAGGGLPFEMRPEEPTYEDVAVFAYKAPIDSDGIAVLPVDWDDDDE